MRKLALVVAFLAAACSEGYEPTAEERANPADIRPGKGGLSDVLRTTSFSVAAADESRAAEVGRDILIDGGNAIDAAVGMYFALAVTLPSAAGLGASGACIVHNSKSNVGEAFVFPPVAAPGPIRGASFMVPIGVRAVMLMHIRHGVTQWAGVVAPAERLARLGVPVSRALSRDLQAGGAALAADREARRVLGRGAGFVTEGDTLIQTDLAGTLGVLRQRGGGEFFSGGYARLLSEQIAGLGGSLPVDVLRGALPISGPPAMQSFGGFRVYVAPAPMAGANALAGWNGQPDPTVGVPTDSGGFAGLAVADARGNAAACSLSMGQLFGARVMVPGTGMLLGAPTADSAAVSPLIVGNPSNGEMRFAGAGGGGPGAAYAVGAIARMTLVNKRTTSAAMAARRGQGGYVDALACPEGIKSDSASCSSGIDPAGMGLALRGGGLSRSERTYRERE